MKSARISIVFLAFCVAAPLLQAAPADQLTGHWTAEVAGEAKRFEMYFDFEVKGDVITGTVELAGRDDKFKITNGKLTGNNLSFISIGAFTGTLEGNDLKLTRELDGGKKQHMIAHKTN